MAEKISVQIALEGGAEVARQLEGIGEAGQKAFADIANSAEQVGGFRNIKPDEVTAKLKDMGITGADAINKIQQAVGKAARLESIVQGVQAVESAFIALGRAAGPIGAAIVAGMTAAAKATIAFADTINKASDQAVKLGFSLEQFKKFQQDFQKLGVSGKAASDVFAAFQANLQKAAQADPGSMLATFGQNAGVARQQLDQFIEQLRRMPDSLQRTKLAMDTLGPAGLQIVQGLRAAEGSMSAAELKAYNLGQAIGRLKTAWDSLGSVTLAPAMTVGLDAITAAINQANQSFLSFAGTLAAGIANPFALLAQQATEFGLSLLGIGPAAQQAGQETAGGLQLVTNALTGMPELVRQATAAPDASSWTSWASTVVSAIGSAIAKLLEWIGLKNKAGGADGGAGGTGATGKARGGLIGGRGTGTSDSNLAWLSRGEFVIRAGAVRQFGAAFFAALNAGRISAFQGGGLIDFGPPGSGGTAQGAPKIFGRRGMFPGFALGGLVPRSLPAFAGGGPVGSMSHVTIQFPGLPPVGGLRASSAVVEELQRSAALAQVRSGGRKPSRYS